MIRKLQSSSLHTKLCLVALFFATTLLVSCPLLLDFLSELSEPAAPENLVAVAGDTAIVLNWEIVDDAVTYRIYRNGTLLATDLTETTYTDDTVTNDVEYTYTVRAVGSTGLESPHSTEATTTLGVPPAAPGNLVALGRDAEVVLIWEIVDDTVTYRVYRDGELLATALTETTYTDDTVTNDIEYRYTVRALDSFSRESSGSDEVSVTPSRESSNGDEVSPTPSRESSNGDEVSVTPSRESSNGDEVSPTPSRESSDRNEVSATPIAAPTPPVDATPIAAPPPPRVVWGGGIVGAGELRWIPVHGGWSPWGWVHGDATYRIYRNGEFIATIDTDRPPYRYTDTDVTAGTEYTYTVRTVDSTGTESSDSRSVVVTPPSIATFDNLSDAGNNDPQGIWSDGTTMWVSDRDDKKLYAYNLASREHDPAKDFPTPHVRPMRGIWANADTMWVAAWNDKIYAYNRSDKSRNPSQDFTDLRGDERFWSIGQVSYDLQEIDGDDFNPTGIWSDGTTMWVAFDFSAVDDYLELGLTGSDLYAYNLETKERDPAKDIDTLVAAGNEQPYGMWSDGTTMWVTNGHDDKIYAYNLASGEPSAQNFNTLDFIDIGNTDERYPTALRDLWISDTTMWVLDLGDRRLDVYDLESGDLIP